MKCSIIKKRLHLIIIRAYIREKNLHNSKNYINFAHFFGGKVPQMLSKILKIVYFEKSSLQNEPKLTSTHKKNNKI